MLTFLKDAASGLIQGAKWLWNPARRKWVMLALTAILAIILITAAIRSIAEKKALEKDLASARAETELVTRARHADNGAITHNQDMKAAIAAKEDRGLQRTKDALEANAGWALQPIPSDVLDSLHD